MLPEQLVGWSWVVKVADGWQRDFVSASHLPLGRRTVMKMTTRCDVYLAGPLAEYFLPQISVHHVDDR